MVAAPILNELAQQIFLDNKAKGFWSEQRSIAEILVLVQSEMFEALEADRKNRFSIKIPAYQSILALDNFQDFFVDNIKDTVEDELADTVIRILDMAGAWQLKLQQPYLVPSLYSWAKQKSALHLLEQERYSIPACVLEISALVSKIIQESLGVHETTVILKNGANDLLVAVLAIAQHFRVDIWAHVHLKLAFNRMRAAKHGKRY